MRILKVTQSYSPFLERGGQAGTVRDLARGLAARGHSVTVLTADLSHGRRTDLGESNAWGRRLIEDDVEIVYLSTVFTFRALTVNPGLSGFCRARLAEFDRVHLYGLYDLMGPAVARFSKQQGIRYLVEPMGMFHPIDRALFLKKVWHRTLGVRMIRNAWRMIATAELERTQLIEAGIAADRVLLRYNPVDMAEYRTLPPRGTFRTRWNIPPDQPLVLFLSRLIPRKGADLLIQAFAEAMPSRGTLVIAGPEGEPGYLDFLKGVVEKCGVPSRVRFTGALYGEEKKSALADADVFALPSSYENFANAVAEAVASNVPVVVTDRCGIHSLVDGRAGLVVPRENSAVAEALRRLTEDENLYSRLHTGCRSVAEELSLERTVLALESIYTSQSSSSGDGDEEKARQSAPLK